MAEEVIGTVTAVRRDGRGIQVDGDWYSSYHALEPVPSKGDRVKFPYKTKGSFKNISGKVMQLSSDGPESTGDSSKSSKNSGTTQSQKQHYGFPIGPRDQQRAIIRQNALTNARELVAETGLLLPEHIKSNEMLDEYAKEIIRIARQFEAYATGDIEMAAARELKKKSSEEEALSKVMEEDEEDN